MYTVIIKLAGQILSYVFVKQIKKTLIIILSLLAIWGVKNWWNGHVAEPYRKQGAKPYRDSLVIEQARLDSVTVISTIRLEAIGQLQTLLREVQTKEKATAAEIVNERQQYQTIIKQLRADQRIADELIAHYEANAPCVEWQRENGIFGKKVRVYVSCPEVDSTELH